MRKLGSFWRHYHLGRWLLLVLLIFLFLLPVVQIIAPERKLVSNSLLFSFTQLFMLITLANNWNLTGGFTGYVDFGHAVFFGLGAYGTGVMMAKIGWSFVPALITGAIIAALFALLIGSATLRLKGPYFSIAMLGTFVAMREIVRIVKPITGGGTGLTLPPYLNRPLFYYVTLIMAIVVVAFAWWLIRRTEFGSTLIAIREDEIGAETRGINTTLHKITIFMIGAVLTGIVGGLWAYQNTFIDPDIVFFESRTVEMVMMVMLGGLGTVAGPVIGATVLYWLRDILWANLLQFHLIAQGLILILIVLFLPEGIVGSFDDSGTSLGRLWGRTFGSPNPEKQTAEEAEVSA
ncbi:MAG: branched-chain amino acid ABC transporter permease [Candidatus Promineifilaceae bacterium]|nr:branched-chain amino acid ABC transporter permease [Candidatus Promineifilaceae bacterium]